MRNVKYLLIIFIFLMMLSCILDPEEYIPVTIVNYTQEDLKVNAGTLISLSYTVSRNSASTITGIKGVSITITGKNSGLYYGSRKFYSKGTWTVR